VQPPLFVDTCHRTSGGQKKEQVLLLLIQFQALTTNTVLYLVHPKLSWSNSTNSTALQFSGRAMGLDLLKWVKVSFFSSLFCCTFPSEVGKMSARRSYIVLGGITAF